MNRNVAAAIPPQQAAAQLAEAQLAADRSNTRLSNSYKQHQHRHQRRQQQQLLFWGFSILRAASYDHLLVVLLLLLAACCCAQRTRAIASARSVPRMPGARHLDAAASHRAATAAAIAVWWN